jgi:NAD(P)-dependent dehydrogenase (short-subunit alcohol dehydrogenase family)
MSDGRTVIVTGGTGALGQAVVAAFLAAGDRVWVPWIVAAEEARMRERFAAALAEGRLGLLEADVAEAKGAEQLVARAGEPAVLVNGAGGFEMGGANPETPLEAWDRMYRINLRTAVSMTRAALPGLRARGRGAIVNVASAAALDPPAGIGAYAASKAALVAFTRSLARELPPGVRVNAVVPTTIDTPANRAAMPDADFTQWTPPEAIARVIAWLASDAASAVRGALVPV